MDTVGQILKAAREEKGYALKEISMQTNMGMKYLTAIEADKFEVFPSETHVIGFIRNYARFLDLEEQSLIDRYKRIVLQETPAPLEELTAPNKTTVNPMYVAAGVGGFFIVFLLVMLLSGGRDGDTQLEDDKADKKQVEQRDATRWYAVGETFTFQVDGQRRALVFEAVSNDVVHITLDGKRTQMRAGEKRSFDLNSDKVDELKITIEAVEAKRVQATVQQPRDTDQNERSRDKDKDKDKDNAEIKGRTIVKSMEQVEINLAVTASGTAQVIVVKDNQERSSHFLKQGEKASFLARNTILITVTNPGNLRLELNGKTLRIETGNAVAGFLFKWRKDAADGAWHLEYEQVQ